MQLKIKTKRTLLSLLLASGFTFGPDVWAQTQPIQPAFTAPARGFVSKRPASNWEHSPAYAQLLDGPDGYALHSWR